MSESHPACEPSARRRQGLAHVTEQQELARRNAAGMGREMTLADKDVALGKELAQMIVGAAVAEPELENRAVKLAHQLCRKIETDSLRLEPADEAVEPNSSRIG